jgi:cell division protein FtsW (lipid II flippase)
MNSTKSFRLRTLFAGTALFLGLMVATLAPRAYGQECDPTWFDPWAGPNTAAVHSTQSKAAVQQHEQKVKTVAANRHSAKLHLKRVASQTKPS